VVDISPRRSNTTLISHIECPGGGQVWVEGTTLYVGHMRPTSGTTIFDVADPRAPRIIAQLPVREGWHSHKVRVAGGVMLVNQEKFGKASQNEIGGGLNVYDVANPSEPKRSQNGAPSAAACTASTLTAATLTSRRQPRVMSATL
jgi:hypothetical protein